MTGPPWPVFVLSLPGCEARRARLLAALTAQGVGFEVVLGVDGRKGLPPEHEAEVDRPGTLRAMGRAMSDAEYACALSHQRIYALIAERGLPGAIVLEDDAIPLPGFAAFLAAGAQEGCDLTLFDYDGARVMIGSRRRPLPGIETWELATGTTLATGYAVSRRGAAYLRQAGLPVRRVADWPCDITRIGARVVHPRLIGHPPGDAAGSAIQPSRAPLLAARRRAARDPARFADPAYWRGRLRRFCSFWLVRKRGG
ncbi:MAG: glycosyltransferase family 25 protein [Acetobacteraceae bacterium]|nr:glycosyltransferase family 25 protein [Acetobacteraceae bacterium]